MKKEVVYIEIEPELKEKIMKYSYEDKRSMKSFIVFAIENKIKEIEQNAK
jgi:hypothetical protein